MEYYLIKEVIGPCHLFRKLLGIPPFQRNRHAYLYEWREI